MGSTGGSRRGGRRLGGRVLFTNHLMSVPVLVGVLVPLALLQGQIVGCTNQTLDSLLDDEVVEQALQDAFDDMWADVEPTVTNDPENPVQWDEDEVAQAKEQGGWIYDCRQPDGSWSVKVVRWPEGGYDSVGQGPRLEDPNCQLVAEFHTHTGSHSMHPLNDGTPNQEPSKADHENADSNGVPGIIVYGHKGDPGSYGVTSYGSSTVPSTPCPGENPAESAGEPHLRTFDGLPYDFQAAGEFVLVRSTDDDLQVQSRQEPTATGHVTQNTAVAVRIDGATIEVNETDVVVDGVAEPRSDFDSLSTPGGGTVRNDNGIIRFLWTDGSEMAFVGRAVVLQLSADRAGAVEGLLGDFDGRAGNDLIGADGEPLDDDGRLTFEEIYGSLADAWRIDGSGSLFTYPPGSSTETFDLRDIPRYRFDRSSIDPDELEDAEAVCRDAGIEDERRLEDCVFDVAATGDDTFADEAAAVEAEVARPTSTGGDSALIDAIGAQRVEEVQRLLAEGADVDQPGEDGRPPLVVATYTGNRAVVAALLEGGADPNGQEGSGRTALHVAGFWGFEDIAELLLSEGADRAITDDDDRTAADLAREQGNDELAERLS